MSSMRDQFEKAGIKGTAEGAMKKTCKICREPLKDNKFDICYKCRQQKRGGQDWTLPPQYLTKLEKGYFDTNDYLWEDFITTMADNIARTFKGLKNHQLRRFYGHIKAADNRLRLTGDWNAVNLDVKQLAPFVAEAKGKGKVPESFYTFIDANMKKINSRRDFEAFVEHFQAVVAYFTYYNPKD